MQTTQSTRRGGFTLLEILVVVVIIIALLGMLIAGVGGVMRAGADAGQRQFGATLEMGLGAFQNDFGSLPPSAGEIPGSATVVSNLGGALLCHALLGPLNASGDGKDGFGFKKSGRVYGPYATPKNDATIEKVGSLFYFTMASSANKQPFLYYKAQPDTTHGATINTVWGSGQQFDSSHNGGMPKTGTPESYPATDAADFTATLRAAKYLIVAPGPDDRFGTEDDVHLSGQ